MGHPVVVYKKKPGFVYLFELPQMGEIRTNVGFVKCISNGRQKAIRIWNIFSGNNYDNGRKTEQNKVFKYVS